MIRIFLGVLAAAAPAVASVEYINPDMLTCDETICREYFGGDQWVTRDPKTVCEHYPDWPNCDKLTAGSKVPQACRDATKLEGITQTISDGLKCMGDLVKMLPSPSPTPEPEHPEDLPPAELAPPPREVKSDEPEETPVADAKPTEKDGETKPDSTGDDKPADEPLLAEEPPNRPEPLTRSLTPTPSGTPEEPPATEPDTVAFASPDPEPQPQTQPERRPEPEQAPDDSVHGAGPNPLAGMTGTGVVIKRNVAEILNRLEDQEPGRLKGGLEIRRGPHGTGTAGESAEEKVRAAFLEWQDRANRLLDDPKAKPEELAASLRELSRFADEALGPEAKPLKASIDKLLRAAESGEGFDRADGESVLAAEGAAGRGVASLPFPAGSEGAGDVILTDRGEIRRITGGTAVSTDDEAAKGTDGSAVPTLTASTETGRLGGNSGKSDVTRFLGETTGGSANGGAWGRLKHWVRRQWVRLTGDGETADRRTASVRGALGPRGAGSDPRASGLLSSFAGGASGAAVSFTAAAVTGLFLLFLWRRRKRR